MKAGAARAADQVGSQFVPFSEDPLFPENSPILSGGGTQVTQAQRGDSNGAYTFTLPSTWTEGTIGLTAVVNPGRLVTPQAFQSCPSCFGLPNVASLTDIAFTPTRSIAITPIALLTNQQSQQLAQNGTTPFGDPSNVFNAAANVIPVGQGQVALPPLYQPGGAAISVDDIVNHPGWDDNKKNDEALARVAALDGLFGSGDVTIGVNNIVGPGCPHSSGPAVLRTLLRCPGKEKQAFGMGDCRGAARGRVAVGGRQNLGGQRPSTRDSTARNLCQNEPQSNRYEHRFLSECKTSHGAYKLASQHPIQAAIRRPARSSNVLAVESALVVVAGG